MVSSRAGRRVEYFSKFSPAPASAPGSFAGALVERMAGRVLLFFVRHAALLRPLSQAGRVQLAKARALTPLSRSRLSPQTWRSAVTWERPGVCTRRGAPRWACRQCFLDGDDCRRHLARPASGSCAAPPRCCKALHWCRRAAVTPLRALCAQDMAELEAAVAQNLLPLDALGAPGRVLRAFRPLLFLEPAGLGASPLLGALPPSVVAHHLYSRAPPQLQAPHARSGITPAQVGPPCAQEHAGQGKGGSRVPTSAAISHGRSLPPHPPPPSGPHWATPQATLIVR